MKYDLPTNVKFNKELFQERMRIARLEKNYSYRELSDFTGISKSTLHLMETKCSDIVPLVNVMAVAIALGVDMLYLIGIKDDKFIEY